MTDIMLDLETMSTEPNAAIVAIGAIKFDIQTGVRGSMFYQVVNLESSVGAGGIIDPKTVCWWLRQSYDTRAIFLNNDGEGIEGALVAFTEWVPTEEFNVWGNGAAFDNVILTGAYHRCGITPPWSYHNDRCYRTMKQLYPDITIPRVDVTHNALDDAIWQTNHLLTILDHIGYKK